MVFVEDVRHNEGPAINLAGPFCGSKTKALGCAEGFLGGWVII